MELIADFTNDGIDTMIQPYTAFGNCGDYVYLAEGKELGRYNVMTGEKTETDLPNAVHYHHDGKVYSTAYVWKQFPRSLFYIDGVLQDSYEYPVGQDRTLNRVNGEWLMYIRSHPYTDMSLSIQTSNDFADWSDLQPVTIEGIADDERVYSFAFVEIDGKHYGIGNVYKFHPTDPYGDAEYSLTPNAFEILDWNLISRRKEIDLIKNVQVAMTPAMYDGGVYLSVIESARKHTTAANKFENVEKPYSSSIVRVEKEDLLKYYK